MSFVLDQVQRIDASLDRFQLRLAEDEKCGVKSSEVVGKELDPQIVALQGAIRGLSAPADGSSSAKGLVKIGTIRGLLKVLLSEDVAGAQGAAEDDDDAAAAGRKDAYREELEWLLVCKATTQVYGHVLDRILEEAVNLSEDLWYWDEVLSSRAYTALYSVQTSPLRLWAWTGMVWQDVKSRGGNFSFQGVGQDAQDTVTGRWKEFYGLVRQVVKERSVKEVHKQLLSPVTRIRSEVRQKQEALKRVRIRHANALGVLLGEGLGNESTTGGVFNILPNAQTQYLQRKLRASIARNVGLMEAVLLKINDSKTPTEKFDAAVGELTDDDPYFTSESADLNLPAQAVAERLARVLTLGLSQYQTSTSLAVQEHGKPSRVVRYWLPVTIGVLSSSTILRILAHRQAEVVQWIQDLGTTVVDFWQNWVVEPTRNLIKTIRHDEGSEISIMSKRSLEGDRDSLERMVVDFAIDNPTNATGSNSSLTETEIADIRSKVREGDLTPVLKAYEKDLTSPLMGAVRGNLIRALLIQIQKTKVDVEIAMGGIDSLLKSQELLIGFISLTPGLLVAYGVTRYIRASLTQKRGSKAQRKQGKMLRQLRNVDRIMTSSTPTEYGELSYKDQGLLLCEVHVLREAARMTMPGEIYREFSEEADELCDVRVGIERQKAVASRMRWAYGKWLT
ncbi:related to NCA2 [Lecanosticta acicola]|uniref:Related to NCA2 n=1 Tax=Lecanosticta acicola TaxID=111012 RepID=A0AAI8Z834_9PEZI|nr:related to NCA2 [Lecanosticta acicola]